MDFRRRQSVAARPRVERPLRGCSRPSPSRLAHRTKQKVDAAPGLEFDRELDGVQVYALRN